VPSRVPPVTSLLSVLLVLVAIGTLGPQPVVPAEQLAFDGSRGAAGVAAWWAAHGSLTHLLGNLAILWWVAPPLERHVGALRTGLAAGAGMLGGLAAHVGVHGSDVAILGSSSVVAALAAYNLVVGWHCPLETRSGRAVVWPSHLFHGVLAVETVRMLAELATGAMPTGAAAHLGGLVAGVVVCGALHGRWPSRPASRTPLRSRPVVPTTS
jgi:membrane associated rhomboid family serine protease